MPNKPLTIEEMITEVAESGGEYSYITDKGQIQQESIHRTEPCQT